MWISFTLILGRFLVKEVHREEQDGKTCVVKFKK